MINPECHISYRFVRFLRAFYRTVNRQIRFLNQLLPTAYLFYTLLRAFHDEDTIFLLYDQTVGCYIVTVRQGTENVDVGYFLRLSRYRTELRKCGKRNSVVHWGFPADKPSELCKY